MANTVSRTISDATLSRIIQIESAGNPRAAARTSSALGLGQFLNGTWLQTVRQHRPDLLNGRTQAQVLALRANPSLSIELLARFTEDNARVLGAGYTDGDLYLAHFSGSGVARKLLRARQDASCATCYAPAAIAANRSILEGKTVGEVRAWSARKMANAGARDWVAQFYRPIGAEIHPGAEHVPPDDDTPVKIDHDGREPATPPADAGVQGDPEIWNVQRRLKAMNYRPGGLDGKWGGGTGGAITAFINDRHLALSAPTSLEMFRDIAEPLKAELASAESESFTRPIAKERAQASPTEVGKTIETVDATKTSRLWAWVLGIPSAITAGIKGIADNFETALQSPTLNTIKDFFADNLLYVALAAVGIAGAIWWQSRKAEQATVKAFQEGRLT